MSHEYTRYMDLHWMSTLSRYLYVLERSGIGSNNTYSLVKPVTNHDSRSEARVFEFRRYFIVEMTLHQESETDSAELVPSHRKVPCLSLLLHASRPLRTIRSPVWNLTSALASSADTTASIRATPASSGYSHARRPDFQGYVQWYSCL